MRIVMRISDVLLAPLEATTLDSTVGEMFEVGGRAIGIIMAAWMDEEILCVEIEVDPISWECSKFAFQMDGLLWTEYPS